MNLSEPEVPRIQRHLRQVEAILRARDTTVLLEDLRAERSANLDRLHAYCERGVFPQNPSLEKLTPRFLDEEGRACAVGHLMITSGAWRVAEEISRTQNEAYVPEITHPGAAEWIAHSGLTLEECAMIQPDYGRWWPHRFVELPLDSCEAGAGGPVRVLVNVNEASFFITRRYTEVVTGPFDASAVRVLPGRSAAQVVDRPRDPESSTPTGVVITRDVVTHGEGAFELRYEIDLDEGELSFSGANEWVSTTGDQSARLGLEPRRFAGFEHGPFEAGRTIGDECLLGDASNPAPGVFALRGYGQALIQSFPTFQFQSDELLFVWKEVYGDFRLEATIGEGASPFGWRGLMARESCHRRSRYALLYETSREGVGSIGFAARPEEVTTRFDIESSPRDISEWNDPALAGKTFRRLRLERAAGLLKAFVRDDSGQLGPAGEWILVSPDFINLGSFSDRLLIGLAVSSVRGCGEAADVTFEGCEVLSEVVAAPRFRRGDSTADGELNITDAVRTLEYLFRGGVEITCLDAADADDSGRVDISDAIGVLGWLFLGPPPRPNFNPTACAIDVTPSTPPFAKCAYGSGNCE